MSELQPTPKPESNILPAEPAKSSAEAPSPAQPPSVPPPRPFRLRAVLALAFILTTLTFTILYMWYTVNRSRQMGYQGNIQKNIIQSDVHVNAKSLKPDAAPKTAPSAAKEEFTEDLFYAGKFKELMATDKSQALALFSDVIRDIRRRQTHALSAGDEKLARRLGAQLSSLYLEKLKLDADAGDAETALRGFDDLVNVPYFNTKHRDAAVEMIYKALKKSAAAPDWKPPASSRMAEMMLLIAQHYRDKNETAAALFFYDRAIERCGDSDTTLHSQALKEKELLERFLAQKKQIDDYAASAQSAESCIKIGDVDKAWELLKSIPPVADEDVPELKDVKTKAETLRMQIGRGKIEAEIDAKLKSVYVLPVDVLKAIASYKNKYPDSTKYDQNYEENMGMLEEQVKTLKDKKLPIEQLRIEAREESKTNPSVALYWAEEEIINNIAGYHLGWPEKVKEPMKLFLLNKDIFTEAQWKAITDNRDGKPFKFEDTPLHRYQLIQIQKANYDKLIQYQNNLLQEIKDIPPPTELSDEYLKNWDHLHRLYITNTFWYKDMYIPKIKGLMEVEFPIPVYGKEYLESWMAYYRAFPFLKGWSDLLSEKYLSYYSKINLDKSTPTEIQDCFFNQGLFYFADMIENSYINQDPMGKTYFIMSRPLKEWDNICKSGYNPRHLIIPIFFDGGQIKLDFVMIPKTELTSRPYRLILGKSAPANIKSEKETPSGKVNLQPFRISTTEIVENACSSLMKVSARRYEESSDKKWTVKFPPLGLTMPVKIKPSEALEFCHWLTMYSEELGIISDGQHFTLPTIDQWVCAAQGTDSRVYPWGNDWNANLAVCAERGDVGPLPAGSIKDGASPVGCLDMAGNVAEWVTYKTPDGQTLYIAMGGSFKDDRSSLTATSGVIHSADYSADDIGFRIVLVTEPETK